MGEIERASYETAEVKCYMDHLRAVATWCARRTERRGVSLERVVNMASANIELMARQYLADLKETPDGRRCD